MVLAEFIKLKHGLYKSCDININPGYNARTMFTPIMFSRGRLRQPRVDLPGFSLKWPVANINYIIINSNKKCDW